MKAKIISPLIKVFPDQDLEAEEYRSASALGEEYFDLQIAYYSDYTQTDISLIVESDIKEIEFGMVGFAVSEMPGYPDHDEYVLRDTPGIYPDPIHMVTGNKDIEAVGRQWRSLYVTIKSDVKFSGENTIRFIFKNGTGEELVTLSFRLEIINKNLPKQKILHTEWFYFDCLATSYHTEVFSDKHWELLENYLKNYAEHGMNMVLTPLFTPALETEVGGERPTVQLVDIEKNNGVYRFNFDKLVKWFRLCQKHGVEYFELCHLYTQWGAYNAPKIIVKEDGRDTQAFGWNTNAHEQEYKEFLTAFVPQLIKVIEQENLEQKCYFHISDEPFEEIFDVYKSASEMLKTLTGDYPIMDALSDYRFYEEKLLDVPVVASDHIHMFIEKKVENLWVYYCCAQMGLVSNRSFNMSGSRTRIIGAQMYKFDIKGFLHWGYNHWYSGRSINQKINPYLVSDASHAFPSGDAFLIYPHPYGDTTPVNSIRIKYMRQAMQDIRALELLESYVGKDKGMELLEEDSVAIDFFHYERDDNWILNMRERLNRAIKLC
jgi:hypothetical protein